MSQKEVLTLTLYETYRVKFCAAEEGDGLKGMILDDHEPSGHSVVINDLERFVQQHAVGYGRQSGSYQFDTNPYLIAFYGLPQPDKRIIRVSEDGIIHFTDLKGSAYRRITSLRLTYEQLRQCMIDDEVGLSKDWLTVHCMVVDGTYHMK